MTARARLVVVALAAALLACLFGQVVAAPPSAPPVVLCQPAISVEGRLHCGDAILAVLDALCGPQLADADTDADRGTGDLVVLSRGCAVDGRIPGSELVALGVRIDLNRASASELEGLPGIGPTLARRIVEARPLRRVEDLLRVHGIGPVRLAKLRSLVTP